MEIVLKNVSYTYKNKKILNKITTTFENNKITGITGDNKSTLCQILDSTLDFEGNIEIGDIPAIKENLKTIRKTVSLINQNYEEQFFTNNVREEMLFLISRLSYKPSNINKKMIQALEIVGLSDSVLNKNIDKLTNLEKKLFQIAVSIIYNPDIIIFDEALIDLDRDNRNNIIRLIKKLRDKYKKTIIISSNDVNTLYEITDNIIILKKGIIYKEGKTNEVYEHEKLDCDIDIPDLVRFTTLARKKKIKLSYHKDIRDLIKDVYKHV